MSTAKLHLAAVSAAALAAGTPAVAQAPTDGPVVVRAAHRIDVRTGSVESPGVVVVEGGRVKAVGPDVSVPAGARIVDLGDAVLLPGLIDCHTHVTSDPGDYYERLFRRSPIDVAVTAHVFARRTLEAGFTTVRNVGAPELVDVALRNAIERGEVVGPRLFVSGLALGATGGHADLVGFSPYLRFDRLSGIADGVDEIRKKVRFNVKYGADLIKVVATAGVLSEEESVGAPQYTLAELEALVDEAHMWGRKVAAHAHGAEGIRRAILAGVDSVEHASLIDEEGIRLAVEKGTFLVMDVYNDDYIVSEYERLGFPPRIIEKEKRIGRLQRENFRKAVRAGARIAYGTDSGVYPHGWNAKQFAKMVEWGMTPIEALRAATLRAAELLGREGELGVLAPGARADLVAVAASPLEDISVMESVVFVMKDGVVYKNERKEAAGR